MKGLLVGVLAMGCAHGSHDASPAPSNRPSPPMVVETIDQAIAAKGKPAHVKGIAQRQMLGDTIAIGNLTILCVGATFPDTAIGKPIAADGTLSVTTRYRAHVGPHGEQSAGMAPGSSQWVLEPCTPR